jgi:ligand-binding sensor domain-containing protein
MAEDNSGTYWFLAGRRLWKYDGQRILEYDEEAGMTDISHRILLLHDGTQLYAGGDNGYTIIDISEAEPTFTSVTEEDGWDFGNIRDLAIFQGEVYAATTEGLVRLSGTDWEMVLDGSFVNLPNRNIATLAPTADGRLVLGTTSGLAYFDGTNVTAEPAVTASISDIAIGRDGTSIWAVGFNSGTFFGEGGNPDGGIYHHDGSGWNHIAFADGLPMTSPRAVLVDNAGTIWVGFGDSALGGGIFRIVP